MPNRSPVSFCLALLQELGTVMRPNFSLFNQTSRRYRGALANRSALRNLPSVEIVISEGRAIQLVREVTWPVYLIGASSDCDLVLGDPGFPAVHAYLFMTDHGVQLRRLGAPPEIRVNGQVVDVALLETGDQIDLDPFQFRIRIRDQRTDERCATGRWN